MDMSDDYDVALLPQVLPSTAVLAAPQQQEATDNRAALMTRPTLWHTPEMPYPSFDASPMNADADYANIDFVALFQRTQGEACVAAALLSEAARGMTVRGGGMTTVGGAVVSSSSVREDQQQHPPLSPAGGASKGMEVM